LSSFFMDTSNINVPNLTVRVLLSLVKGSCVLLDSSYLHAITSPIISS